MSKETLTWLNQNTLIGYTAKRGTAWHYRASDQGDEPNHYVGAIPVDDVIRRLFFWTPVEGTVETTYMTEDGVSRITDPDRKTIIRPDTQTILGLFKSGFRVHEFRLWLLENVADILDADLAIGSAGLLKGGAVAWVQIEMEDTITTPEGVAFRPHLTAATSLDGSMSSTYLTGNQLVVCDNTLAGALGERSHMIKVKHSRFSLGKINDVRDALGIVHTMADEFAAEVKALCEVTVTDTQWREFTKRLTDPGKDPSPRSKTMADNKVAELHKLWKYDERVAPWTNTAYGVVAAVNTYEHHIGTVRNAHRAERNALRSITGDFAKVDHATLDLLGKVLQPA